VTANRIGLSSDIPTGRPGTNFPASGWEIWMKRRRTKYPKMFAIRAGDILVTYAGFTCIPAGVLVRVECDAVGLYFRCADGNHYLESQRDENDECLGLSHAPLA
jgi:hypothetical protein